MIQIKLKEQKNTLTHIKNRCTKNKSSKINNNSNNEKKGLTKSSPNKKWLLIYSAQKHFTR